MHPTFDPPAVTEPATTRTPPVLYAGVALHSHLYELGRR